MGSWEHLIINTQRQIMTNVRNARNVWGEASAQYGAAVTIAVAYFRSLHGGGEWGERVGGGLGGDGA